MVAPPVPISSPPQRSSNEGTPEHGPDPTVVHTLPALQLQLQLAMRALVDVLNHSDDALQAGVIRELEQRTGLTVYARRSKRWLCGAWHASRTSRPTEGWPRRSRLRMQTMMWYASDLISSWNSGSGLASRCAAPRSCGVPLTRLRELRSKLRGVPLRANSQGEPARLADWACSRFHMDRRGRWAAPSDRRHARCDGDRCRAYIL
jgi:hypothetical protein